MTDIMIDEIDKKIAEHKVAAQNIDRNLWGNDELYWARISLEDEAIKGLEDLKNNYISEVKALVGDELDYTAYGPEPAELNANLYTAEELQASEEALLNEQRG